MSERNIKLLVEYRGTAYAGWQIQANQQTIQGELTNAIFQTTGQKVNLIGAGRTDAGVHALGQTANFRINHHIEPEKYKEALNFYLDDDIRVKKSYEVSIDFHSRKHALWKRYRYLIGTERSALFRELRWEIERDLDFSKLKSAAEFIVGEHDFSPFCVVSSRKEDNHCIIHSAKWTLVGPLLVFEIRGNRFLHNMVRILVGSMVNLATIKSDNHRENLTLDRFADILSVPTDKRVVFTAPPQGLYLVTVNY